MNLESNAVGSYLDLMKKCLTRYAFPDTLRPLRRPSRAVHPWAWAFYPSIAGIFEKQGLRICRYVQFDPAVREEGRDWPPEADTMIGLRRLDNLQFCIEQVKFPEISSKRAFGVAELVFSCAPF